MAMDFISGPTTTTTAATTTVTTPRTPDSDTDTPPYPPPSKRSHHHNNHHHTTTTNNNNPQHVSYKECMKNHAASIGGHALDGCCEFMPGPTANLLDPTSLTCAACGCHRNFHRRDPDDPTPLHHLIPLPAPRRPPHSPPSASQLLLSLSGHTQSPSAPSDHEMLQHNTTGTGGLSGGVVMGYYNNGGGGQNGNNLQNHHNFQSKKRYRTKFSQDQKEKMYEFSEKIGWKLKKGEERLVEEFCKDVGVDRTVFKVWMHNNKHSSTTSSSTPPSQQMMMREKIGIITPNSNNSPTNPNITNNSNVSLNCGGVLATNSLEFNFANGGGQEAKAQ